MSGPFVPEVTSPSASATGRGAEPAVRIGTRGSALALRQTEHVQRALGERHPDRRFELVVMQSEGDLDKRSPLTEIGGRGVFASHLQQALTDGAIDMAVHSSKDVPTLSPPGLAISAFTTREDPRDVVVSRHGVGLDRLPANPVIGTSSQRRAVQIRRLRPDARVVELRGNIDTRLRKAAGDEYDAVVLAAAGLMRMGWEGRVTEFLPVTRCIPSPGQGALAIETRAAPDPAASLAAVLDDPVTAREVAIERQFLRSVGGGCTAPIGAYACIETLHGRDVVRFWAVLGSDDGSRLEHAYDEFSPDAAEAVVAEMSAGLLGAVRGAGVDVGRGSGPDADAVLLGRTVLVTGTAAVAGPMVAGFRDHGAEAHHVATIVNAPAHDERRLADAIAATRRGDYAWLIVTSGNAVDAIGRHARAGDGSWPVRTAVVGATTARRMRDLGFDVTVEPEDQRGAGLLAAMAGIDLAGQRILCLFGDRARATIPDGLRARGARVDIIEAYRTVPVADLALEIRRLVRAGAVDAVTFASPSSVSALRALLGVDLAALSGACLVAIGPTTATAMDAAGMPAHAVAVRPDVDGVVQAVAGHLLGRPATPRRNGTSHA